MGRTDQNYTLCVYNGFYPCDHGSYDFKKDDSYKDRTENASYLYFTSITARHDGILGFLSGVHVPVSQKCSVCRGTGDLNNICDRKPVGGCGI